MSKKTYDFQKMCSKFSELNKNIRKNIDECYDNFIVKYTEIEYVNINACFDLIDDSCTGIMGFKIYENNINKNYLNIIGVLQCFYIIQDSIIGIDKILNIKNIKINTNVRKLRNSIIGHPTSYEISRKPLIINSYIIDRYSINESGFEYRIRDEKGDTNSGNKVVFETDFCAEFNNLQKYLEEIETLLKPIYIA